MMKDINRIITKALRHEPHLLDLTPDKAGYCSVSSIIKGLKEKGFSVSKSDIEQVGENERFSFNDESHTKMRADYGNSIGLKLSDMFQTESYPPEWLYHGTSQEFLKSIQQKGIVRIGVNKNKGRDHIFLTESKSVAIKKGSRHGKSVGLPIKAQEMAKAGYKIYYVKNDIWLTDHIPVEYIDFSKMFFTNE